MADSSSSLTPEKRLLNLIESGSKGEAAPAPGEKAPDAKEPAPEKPKLSLKEKLAQLKEKAKVFFLDFKNRFSLKSATNLARVVLGIFVVITVLNAVYELKMSGRDPLAGLDTPERKVTRIDVEEPVFDAATLQNTESRNIFLPFSKREEIQATRPNSGGSIKLIELTKNLKLTGISYNPENSKEAYCMIEDLQKNITLFLHVGDRISGMMISKIMEESVELSYENEKIEIH